MSTIENASGLLSSRLINRSYFQLLLTIAIQPSNFIGFFPELEQEYACWWWWDWANSLCLVAWMPNSPTHINLTINQQQVLISNCLSKGSSVLIRSCNPLLPTWFRSELILVQIYPKIVILVCGTEFMVMVSARHCWYYSKLTIHDDNTYAQFL